LDTIECLQRPYDVHPHNIDVPNTGYTAVEEGKLVKPTLETKTIYTSQPTKKIPGHTGFLTFATLYHKTTLLS